MGEKISQQELIDIFGDSIPTGAVEILCDPNMTVGQVRSRLKQAAQDLQLVQALADIIGEETGEYDEYYDRETAKAILAYLRINGFLSATPTQSQIEERSDTVGSEHASASLTQNKTETAE